MTSASELFYNRRSRFGRNSDPFGLGSDFGSPPPPDRTSRRNRHHNSPSGSHNRRDRLDPDGCDPLRRPPHHPRQTPHIRPSHPPQVRIPLFFLCVCVLLSYCNNCWWIVEDRLLWISRNIADSDLHVLLKMSDLVCFIECLVNRLRHDSWPESHEQLNMETGFLPVIISLWVVGYLLVPY